MLRASLLILLVILGLAGWGYANIVADPVVRRANVQFQSWPNGAAPIRVALIADVHVQAPDMRPDRVVRLAAGVNAHKPDLILLAGDFAGDRQSATRQYEDSEIATALAHFRARLGVFAVLGNHDHWRDGPSMRHALEAAGIRVLENQAVRAGPIALAGIGDRDTDHADPAAADRAAAALPRPLLAFAHSPDVAPLLSPRFGLLLAGHTHCGQIVLPLVGALGSATRYGERYRCGVAREPGRAVVVSSGWGASVLPIRFGAPPDWWLLTLGPVP